MEGQELDLRLARGAPAGHLTAPAPTEPRPQRSEGRAGASVASSGGRTALRRLHQSGCLKLRFPRGPGPGLEAVLVNTAGGLTGGDRTRLDLAVGEGASLLLTTQACERIYRSGGGEAAVETRLSIAPSAEMLWLPQETILFDGGRVRRALHLDCDASSRFVLVESVILGREAMGESVENGLFRDSWRVRRGGRLVFADDTRLSGAIADETGRAASLGGGRAFALVLVGAPDIADRLPQARAILGEHGGASAFDGLLLARLVADDGLALRRRLVPLLAALAMRPLPRLWSF